MRWGGIIQAFNELPENLPRAVASMRKLCDVIVGYDDGSTDGSGAWMDAHLDYCFHGPNDWKDELAHKKLMLDWLKRQEPRVDWILWLDADEELSPPAVPALRGLAETDSECTGITIPEMNLWGDEQHFRIDRQFGNAGFLRAWKNRPELVYVDTERALHRPQFPPAARDRIHPHGLRQPRPFGEGVGEPIVHYSWSSPAKIIAKYERYAAQGQCGESLERLAPDPNAVLLPAPPEWFLAEGESMKGGIASVRIERSKKDGRYYVSVIAANGRGLFDAGNYNRLGDAQRVLRYFNARLVDVAKVRFVNCRPRRV